MGLLLLLLSVGGWRLARAAKAAGWAVATAALLCSPRVCVGELVVVGRSILALLQHVSPQVHNPVFQLSPHSDFAALPTEMDEAQLTTNHNCQGNHKKVRSKSNHPSRMRSLALALLASPLLQLLGPLPEQWAVQHEPPQERVHRQAHLQQGSATGGGVARGRRQHLSTAKMSVPRQ